MQEQLINIGRYPSLSSNITYKSIPEGILSNKVEPFLKWAGGKRQLLTQFERYFPQEFNNYLEPFLGGGAVFFHLYSRGRFSQDKKIILMDSNEELINTYKVIKDNLDELIPKLRNGKYKNEEFVYYKIRSKLPKNHIEKAARTIYLNKTCYNGLYRVNSKKQFNVPFGKYKNPSICNTENLSAVHKALQETQLITEDFEGCINYAGRGDFIYFDPPYQPLSKTSSFTSYTNNSFGEKDQERLSQMFKILDKKGCKVMLSNSTNSFIKKLYEGYRLETVKAKRAINCKAAGRGQINELIILNYRG